MRSHSRPYEPHEGTTMKITNATRATSDVTPRVISVTERCFSSSTMVGGRLLRRRGRRALAAILANVRDDEGDDRARTEDHRAERPPRHDVRVVVGVQVGARRPHYEGHDHGADHQSRLRRKV